MTLQREDGGDATIGRRVYPLLIEAGLVAPEVFDAGVRALYRAAEPDGVFCYTFFKGVAEKRRAER